MKFWRVDNYTFSNTKLCRDILSNGALGEEYYRTPQIDLEDLLNLYEKQGAVIKEIIKNSEGNYEIIYTVEDADKNYGI